MPGMVSLPPDSAPPSLAQTRHLTNARTMTLLRCRVGKYGIGVLSDDSRVFIPAALVAEWRLTARDVGRTYRVLLSPNRATDPSVSEWFALAIVARIDADGTPVPESIERRLARLEEAVHALESMLCGPPPAPSNTS